MVDSQEIIERSIYQAIMLANVDAGYGLNPANYLPVSSANSDKYTTDKQTIIANKGLFIEVYGAGNNESKGILNVPRIVIEPQAFFPGEIGLEKYITEKSDSGDNYEISEAPYDLINYVINIHLVSNTIETNRILHNILNTGIPVRGYLKPYTYDDAPFSGNIFIQLSNYYTSNVVEKGIIEKVYQFTIKDTLLYPTTVKDTITPIIEIDTTIGDENNLQIK